MDAHDNPSWVAKACWLKPSALRNSFTAVLRFSSIAPYVEPEFTVTEKTASSGWAVELCEVVTVTVSAFSRSDPLW
jgi:hypothetical protein